MFSLYLFSFALMKLKNEIQHAYHGHGYQSKTAKHNARISFCFLTILDWDLDVREVAVLILQKI